MSNKIIIVLALVASIAFGFSSCARQSRISRVPPATDEATETNEGMASWYGRRFHGRRTASGVRYNMKKLTAAHRTLPFGTRVRVTNLANDHAVEVVINDRGPFTRHRIIDLSRAAAHKLGMLGAGLAKVRLEVVRDEADTSTTKSEVANGNRISQ